MRNLFIKILPLHFQKKYMELCKTGALVLALFVAAGGCGTVINETDELYDPLSFFLTWQTDPARTMTIDWHVSPDCLNRSTVFHYKKIGTDEWIETTASFRSFPHTDLTIHRVELRNLEPGSSYRVRFGGNSKMYKFNTMIIPTNALIPSGTGRSPKTELSTSATAAGPGDHGAATAKMNGTSTLLPKRTMELS